jgi:hypothetical protein
VLKKTSPYLAPKLGIKLLNYFEETTLKSDLNAPYLTFCGLLQLAELLIVVPR